MIWSKRSVEYDFGAKIEYANLRKINLYKRDSLSKFSGNIKIKALGNSFDDLAGIIDLENVTYNNQKIIIFGKC